MNASVLALSARQIFQRTRFRSRVSPLLERRDDLCREEIGVGGTSIVFRLRYQNGWTEIEKNLLPKFQSLPEFESMQIREFQILRSLNHPLIVRVYRLENKPALGKNSNTQSLILEPVDGVPLSRLSEFLEGLPALQRIKWCDNLLRQLISVLLYLGSEQIVHGDIAPENIFVQPNGYIKLIDFGVARVEEGQPLPFRVAGREQFRAPELMDEGSTSHLGDIYSVGKIYEWSLGTECSTRKRQKKLIGKLLDERALETGLRAGLEPLWPLPHPSLLVQPVLARKPTRIVLQSAAVKHRIYCCILVLAAPLLSTWLPARGKLTVNTLPYSVVTVDVLGEDQQFETPIRELEVPAGQINVTLTYPTEGDRRAVHHLSVTAGQTVKLFEDLTNY